MRKERKTKERNIYIIERRKSEEHVVIITHRQHSGKAKL